MQDQRNECPGYQTLEWSQERFWAKVDKAGPLPRNRPDLGPCWLWTGSKRPRGYGRVIFRGRDTAAHRLAYEWDRGMIATGLVLDHLCRVHSCVNPGHLEAVTDAENILRGVGPPAENARKTHCPKGHPYDEVNTAINVVGARVCKACRLQKARRYNAKRDAAIAERDHLKQQLADLQQDYLTLLLAEPSIARTAAEMYQSGGIDSARAYLKRGCWHEGQR
jgi:hypothetical protein